MVMTRRKPRVTYRQVLENAKQLPPADQERLLAELGKTRRVFILEPDRSPAAVRRGHRLAAKIKKELAEKQTGTLEETMIRLRGKSWSS